MSDRACRARFAGAMYPAAECQLSENHAGQRRDGGLWWGVPSYLQCKEWDVDCAFSALPDVVRALAFAIDGLRNSPCSGPTQNRCAFANVADDLCPRCATLRRLGEP